MTTSPGKLWVANEVIEHGELNGFRGWNQPWGILTPPILRASAQTSIGSSYTDLTGMASAAFTAVGARYVRISFIAAVQQVTSAGLAEVSINTGGSGAGTQLNSSPVQMASGTFGYITGFVVDTPAAGSVQYHLRAKTTGGTLSVNGSSVQPIHLVVEDIGPVTLI